MIKQKKRPFILLNDKKGYSNDCLDVIQSKHIISKYPTLEDYLNDLNLSYDKSHLNFLVKKHNKRIKDALDELAFIMYRIAELSGDWLQFGEDQLMFTYATKLLNYGPDSEFNEQAVSEFKKKKELLLDEYDLRDTSLEDLKLKISNFSIGIFRNVYTVDKIDELNNLNQFFGSTYMVSFFNYLDNLTFIFGLAEKQVYGRQNVYWFKKEIVRSPNLVMAMAAVNTELDIIIRKEALYTIFHHKWHLYKTLPSYSKRYMVSDDNTAIGMGIKDYVMSLFDEDRFKEDMITRIRTNVTYHEIGHGAVESNFLTPKEWGMAYALCQIKQDNILYQFLELFADLAPNIGKETGPFAHILNIAQSDPKRAEQLFYLYLSDTWFFDTEDTYMYPYSELIVLIFLRYINNDKSIDFEQLRSDLGVDYKKNRSLNELFSEGSLLLFMFEGFQAGIQKMDALVTSAQYKLTSGDFSYIKLRPFVDERLRSKGVAIDASSKHYFSQFYQHLFVYYDNFAKNSDSLESQLQAIGQELRLRFFEFVVGKDVASDYGGNIQLYLCDRLKSLGFAASGDDYGNESTNFFNDGREFDFKGLLADNDVIDVESTTKDG